MELFADTILPFDLGLKKFERPVDRAARLKREREAAIAAQRAEEARQQYQKEQDRLRMTAVEEQFSLGKLIGIQLVALKVHLESKQRDTAQTELLEAVNLQLQRRYQGDLQKALARLVNPDVRLPPVTVATGPTGAVIFEGANTGGLITSATAIGAAVAPKKDGGAMGIKKPSAIAAAGGAIVAGLLQVDQFFAANPPDP